MPKPINAAEVKEYLIELLDDAFWNVAFHEQEIITDNRQLELTRALLARADMGVEDDDRVRKQLSECETIVEFAGAFLNDALRSVEYHESELVEAYQKVALVSALAIRAGYQLDAQEIAAQAKARMEEDN